MAREEKVDRFEDRLGSYLVRLHLKPLSDQENQASARYLSYLSNVERISDYSVKIAELAQEQGLTVEMGIPADTQVVRWRVSLLP